MEGLGADLLLPWTTAKIFQGLLLGVQQGWAWKGPLDKDEKTNHQGISDTLTGKAAPEGGCIF
jgi:hypothetical protein